MIFDDVLHSMSRVGTFSTPAGDEILWYGSDKVIDMWLGVLQAEINRCQSVDFADSTAISKSDLIIN